MSKLRLVLLAVVAVLCACGPDILAQARPYVLRSPHRSLAVFPFDYAGGSRNASPQATSAFEAKLRADGFVVANHAKTAVVYNGSVLKKGSFNALRDAAQFAAALGAAAAFVGSVDDAYDTVERHPAVYGRDARGRGVLREPARSLRWAGLSLRVRLVDARTAAVLWSASYSGRLAEVPLSTVADQVTDVLNQQLLEAVEKQQF